MLEVVTSVVVVSVEGGGGGCLVSSCGGWFDMFCKLYRDATRIAFFNFFFLDYLPPFVIDQRRWCCCRTNERLVCEFAEACIKHAEKKTKAEVDECFWLLWRDFEWEKIFFEDQ